MAWMDMFNGVVNSPVTTITTTISASVATIPMAECLPSVVPPAPNMIVLGTGEDAETVYYTGKSTASGPGEITGCTRAFQGVAKEWPAGTPVSRVITEYDHRAQNNNINELKNTALFPKGTIVPGSVSVFDSESNKLVSGPIPGTSPNNLVQIGSDGKLPAIDGSQLLNLPSSSSGATYMELDTDGNLTIVTSGVGGDLLEIDIDGGIMPKV